MSLESNFLLSAMAPPGIAITGSESVNLDTSTSTSSSSSTIPNPTLVLLNFITNITPLSSDSPQRVLSTSNATIIIPTIPDMTLKGLKREIRTTILIKKAFNIENQLQKLDFSSMTIRLTEMRIEIHWSKSSGIPVTDVCTDEDLSNGLDMMHARGWIDVICAEVVVVTDERRAAGGKRKRFSGDGTGEDEDEDDSEPDQRNSKRSKRGLRNIEDSRAPGHEQSEADRLHDSLTSRRKVLSETENDITTFDTMASREPNWQRGDLITSPKERGKGQGISASGSKGPTAEYGEVEKLKKGKLKTYGRGGHSAKAFVHHPRSHN